MHTALMLGILAPFAAALLGSTTTSTSSNPVASIYPNDITGVQNCTFVIIPITLDYARQMIPPQYKILTSAYEQLIPDFPEDSYPLLIQTSYSYDDQAPLGTTPPFQQFQIQLPFVDFLGDGYSSFSYKPYIFLSAAQPVALLGTTLLYGITVVPAFFQPELAAYAYTDAKQDEIYLEAYLNLTDTIGTTLGRVQYSVTGDSPYRLSVIKNITNQPLFRDGLICSNLVTLFNTSLSTGANAPVGISGTVDIAHPYLPNQTHFEGVKGYKVAVAIVEIPSSCDSLKGHGATGNGD